MYRSESEEPLFVDQLSIIDSLSASCLGSGEIKYHVGAGRGGPEGPQGPSSCASSSSSAEGRSPGAVCLCWVAGVSYFADRERILGSAPGPGTCTYLHKLTNTKMSHHCFASLHFSHSGAFVGESSQKWISLFC